MDYCSHAIIKLTRTQLRQLTKTPRLPYLYCTQCQTKHRVLYFVPALGHRWLCRQCGHIPGTHLDKSAQPNDAITSLLAHHGALFPESTLASSDDASSLPDVQWYIDRLYRGKHRTYLNAAQRNRRNRAIPLKDRLSPKALQQALRDNIK